MTTTASMEGEMGVPQEQAFSLADRFDLSKSQVLLNGTQALVRLMLMQQARDRQAGLSTAGLVTGYRGSPLGGVDLAMMKADKLLKQNDILFQPGLNEDLAATAIWGSQQAELRGEGRYDGVFALWYGKGPGIDRSGDVMRHGNMAGSSALGGVVMAMGDDHTGESSTVLHQSDWAMVDAYIPVISPAGVQEILDYGLYAFALSRFAGVWTGLKTMKDTVEATSVVNGDPFRLNFVTPQFKMPDGGLNIRLGDTPVAQEARMIDFKRFAAEAFSRANRLDRPVWGKPGAKIGFVAAGKNWLDLVHALALLGIDEDEAERLGLSTYKIGQTFPMDMKSFQEWSEPLDLVIVVEEKRKLIEVQVKEAIFDNRHGRRVIGWKHDRTGEEVFPTRYALDPVMIAEKLGGILIEEGRGTEGIRAGLEKLSAARRADNAPELAVRTPWYCSGCPHNSSTRVPEGSRAYAGIGCHYMVQWMDRDTLGFTQMGGEGANWVGEAPFSKRPHVFQNLGDGTYNHSGSLAIRHAVDTKTNITYKILFNDAVAMTGGQPNEGGLTAPQIARELVAMGVDPVVVVYDDKEDVDPGQFDGLRMETRDKMMSVQKELAGRGGTSAILYIQTCAAEKRRRRKKGLFPDPDRRIWINPEICEGCGDCGVQSNCVSVVPLDTELGRKRQIEQSSCNKDYSCVNGFCPSFVSVRGGRLKKPQAAALDLPALPAPGLPAIDGTHNIVITGVGGTGVVTIGAVLAQAAHIDGKGAGMMEMAGLAQKGGAVHIHLRLANRPEDISAIRVAVGEADCIIGGDLVVTAGAKTIGLMTQGRTGAVVNDHEIITGEFTKNRNFQIPSERLKLSLQARLGDRAAFFDANKLAQSALGDSIYSNMLVLGAAWQQGLIPLSEDAILKAIELNGAKVAENQRAFQIGRWAMVAPEAVAAATAPAEPAPVDPIDYRAGFLTEYQDAAYAQRFRDLVARAPEDLRADLAEGYFKLLAYKDEYEVARLHLKTAEGVAREFDGDTKLSFHLAPPILPGRDADGRPKKREFGPWILPAFRLLARMKALRGTAFDPFGWLAERRAERAAIAEFEGDMKAILPRITPATVETARELCRLPLSIKGYGFVKDEAIATARARRLELLAAFDAGGTPLATAAE
ncbi:MAG TPA: indolepyruvate ferredoxin oxidoreductase family protein [Paracoccus sp. (in: a-proteobacteria)]|uniref:indolepyruvate ferredoxin oxidoreductase family protein n=1 Tax=uncultured Paracoccus sp. TaxID=189685 RepID=UPI00260B85DA|nr:indolepyruvate ferredoxin oxidoreductase family protein [uncultured Paracoccus sp.]HMQ40718.1 indolepyruvate ferredoxin oxidoreductase family protein [Paracoccus sp. (in: a-proteobacteria)]